MVMAPRRVRVMLLHVRHVVTWVALGAAAAVLAIASMIGVNWPG
jgi:hypothetical protein